jgi:hypothetical protein
MYYAMYQLYESGRFYTLPIRISPFKTMEDAQRHCLKKKPNNKTMVTKGLHPVWISGGCYA